LTGGRRPRKSGHESQTRHLCFVLPLFRPAVQHHHRRGVVDFADALLLGKLLASQKIGFLPFVLSLPPVMLWLGASIFVYASIAHHPNPRTTHYNKWAGYRFYGVMGSLMVIGPAIYGLLGGWQGLMLVLGLAVRSSCRGRFTTFTRPRASRGRT
jgi:hypothetical protein